MIDQSSSSRMRVMTHNWSATKQRLHPQSVTEISHHSVFSGDRIRQWFHAVQMQKRHAPAVIRYMCNVQDVCCERHACMCTICMENKHIIVSYINRIDIPNQCLKYNTCLYLKRCDLCQKLFHDPSQHSVTVCCCMTDTESTVARQQLQRLEQAHLVH